MPVDVISPDQLAKVMAGTKTGKKENPKPLAEKVAEAKPVDDAVGKITEKAPVVTETAPPPQPKVEEKPVEKKPDPPKAVENKPKEEPKPVEKKPDPPKAAENTPTEKKPDPVKPDPIAEAIKKEEKKPPPKPVQARPSRPSRRSRRSSERHFDQTQIAALLDKRDPTRQAATGDTLNSNAALGTAKGTAADNSATWGSMFQRQVERCWKKPYGGIESQKPEAVFAIRLKRDGTLEGSPVPEGTPATPSCASIRRARYARSSNASRTNCRRPFMRNGNISRRCSRKRSDRGLPIGDHALAITIRARLKP